jgi:hypothetical protein
MAGLVSMLTQTLTDDDAVDQVSRRLGIDRHAAGQAVPAAVSLLVGALARNATEPDGARALATALEREDEARVLEDLPGSLERFEELKGNGILDHVLGTRRAVAEQGLAAATGLDMGTSGSLLQMLAPVVMGVLSRLHRQSGQGAGGLGSILSRAREDADAQSGSLLSVLDGNDDGPIGDDIGRLATNLLRHD